MSIYNTVLIIGATSGIGAGLARRIHAQGKKVIITGRRQDRLSSMAASLPGVETSSFDISDISSLSSNITSLTTQHPGIDTVIISAGIQRLEDFTDDTTPTVEGITEQINTNITAPITICQVLIPFFLASKKPSSIILLTSGFSYIPVPFFPIYSATKAALHSFSVALRAQTAKTNITITNLVPPYVESELDIEFKDRLIEILAGKDKAVPQTPMEEFLNDAMERLGKLDEDGKVKKEVAVGHFSEMVVESWRKAFGPALKIFDVEG